MTMHDDEHEIDECAPTQAVHQSFGVTLTGQLICRTRHEASIVESQLARHVELTRAEPGCESFIVVATDDPLIWQVDEHFRDAASFRDHQRRVADSVWGQATAGIQRRYTTRGL